MENLTLCLDSSALKAFQLCLECLGNYASTYNKRKKSLDKTYLNSTHYRKAMLYCATGVQTTFSLVERRMDAIFETINLDERYFLQLIEDEIIFSKRTGTYKALHIHKQ